MGNVLTHWGRVTHTCVSKLTIIGSDNGLSPDRRQAIIWTNAGLLLIGPLGTNFSEILIEILTFSFKKMRFKVSSGKRRPFCLGLNVLMKWSEFRKIMQVYRPKYYRICHRGNFKNAYQLLILRALKNFNIVWKSFCSIYGWDILCRISNVPLKFHTKHLNHTLKDVWFIEQSKFKSS